MKQSKDRAAGKTDILKPEPDVKEHHDSSYDYRQYCVSSHFTTDSRRNTLRCDLICIYSEIIYHSLLKGFSLIYIQS